MRYEGNGIYKTGYGTWYGIADVDVTETDSALTYTIGLGFKHGTGNITSSYWCGDIVIDGDTVYTKGNTNTNITKSGVIIATYTQTVQKTSSEQTLSFNVLCKNSGGVFPGTSTVTFTIQISALPTPKVKIKAGGVWKDGDARVKVNGEWKSADSIFIKVNGTWKEK